MICSAVALKKYSFVCIGKMRFNVAECSVNNVSGKVLSNMLGPSLLVCAD